ncbi:MAG: hypothetical protein RBR40_13530 [Tenuifilaceae bacterium]|jgi:predicted RNase H-like HicB family nuclease|nr:hypothetical protein [Tenuifilaceae bacterium]
MRNNSLIASLTGWRTEYTIEKGLKETIDWFYKPENLRNYKTNINPGTMTRKIKLINKLFSGDTDQSFPFVDLLKYEIIIYWSTEDDCFIAEAPELSGCMADGNDYQEALNNIQLIIDEWIETACSLGRSIPVPKGKLMYA